MKEFRKVAVLGAGVMGSGIAAHLAGAGLHVLLLDIVPPKETSKDKDKRDAFAQGGKDKALKSKPAAFFTPRDADLITVGNLEDDLAAAAKCDLVIEVVKEDLAVKKALFAKLEPLLDAHTILASNTSGLPIHHLMEGRSESVKKRFLVTHFFNPVRYMKLLEVVAGPDTDPQIVEKVSRFGQDVLGKGIVFGKDTPNFVANRIGIFGMMYLIRTALPKDGDDGFTIEEVDAIFGSAMGRPKSAVFRTADVVGLDTVVEVARNCYQNLPNDERREVFHVPAVLEQMVEKKMLGDKTGGGFMKKTPKGIVTLDWKSMEYRPQQKARFASVGATKGVASSAERVKKLLAGDDRAAELARKVTFATLAYASRRIGPQSADQAIADDLVQIDRGMRWGFGWDQGPFETWDALGVAETAKKMEEQGEPPAAWVNEMLAAGRNTFYVTDDQGVVNFWDIKSKKPVTVPDSPRHVTLAALRKRGQVVFENDGATLYDLGDRICGLEFHTKMNAIDADLVTMLQRSMDEAEKNWDGLVIANDDHQAFSAGANIFLVVMSAQQKNWSVIEEMTAQLQQTLTRLRYLSVPSVTAPFGLALGGGAEIAMQGAAARASAELYMGLVEAGVGLIPAGGGCKELLARHLTELPDDGDPFTAVKKIFMQVALAKVSMSAEEARAMGMLRESDAVTLNRDYLITDAKQTALGLARAGYTAPRRRTFRVPGLNGYGNFRSQLQMMVEAHQISAHDMLVGSKLAWVLCGGHVNATAKVTEQHILDLEREAFLSLCGEEKTQARMQHMLMNGKPLRN